MRYILIALLLIFSLVLTTCKSKTAEWVESLPLNEIIETEEEKIPPVNNQPVWVKFKHITGDDDLTEFSNYHSVYLGDNYNERFLFFSDIYPSGSFDILEIGHNEEPFYLYISGVIESVGSTRTPILIHAPEISIIPTWGITYKYFGKRYFYVSDDGVDGSYDLSEFKPKTD